MTRETLQIKAEELVTFSPDELLTLIDEHVVVHLTETDKETGLTAEAFVSGTIELFTLIDGGVALKLVGTSDPISVHSTELEQATLTIWDKGRI